MVSTMHPDLALLELDAALHASQAQAERYARVADFICERSPLAALREAAQDKPMRAALWAPHWARLQDMEENMATLFMCFLLACALLRIDIPRATAAVRQSTRPELSMKLFLAERGLMQFSAEELPALVKHASQVLPWYP
jgi:hypothetical protein